MGDEEITAIREGRQLPPGSVYAVGELPSRRYITYMLPLSSGCAFYRRPHRAPGVWLTVFVARMQVSGTAVKGSEPIEHRVRA